MKISDKVNERRGITKKDAMKLAKSFREGVENSIYELISGDVIFYARWLLVHIDSDYDEIEICFGVRDYEIIKDYGILLEIFEGVNLQGEARRLYKRYVISNISQMLDELGFCNLGTELPKKSNGELHSDRERFSWYVIEI